MQINFQKVVDLSYTVDENSPRELPIDPVKIYDTATIDKDGYFESRVDLSGHCATHIDVPCLMYSEGFTVAEIPQEKLTGSAVLIDLSDVKQPGRCRDSGRHRKVDCRKRRYSFRQHRFYAHRHGSVCVPR